ALRRTARGRTLGAARRGAAAHRFASTGLAELGAWQRAGTDRAAPGAEFRAPVFPAGSGAGRVGRSHRAAATGRRRPGRWPPAGALGLRRNPGAAGVVGARAACRSACGTAGRVVVRGTRSAERSLKTGSEAGLHAPSMFFVCCRLAWVMLLPGGMLRVSQTLPPMVEPWPMVMRPRMVAPA